MRYCELHNREMEYIALTRDTTESDLKQRREIAPGGTVIYQANQYPNPNPNPEPDPNPNPDLDSNPNPSPSPKPNSKLFPPPPNYVPGGGS